MILDRTRLLSATAALVVAGAALAIPRPAEACGGFFCNRSAPVDQTGENILFAMHDDGTIETHVQIQYMGPSEEFAWIVPVPSAPIPPTVEDCDEDEPNDIDCELAGVSSDTVFQRLGQMLRPRFVLNWREIGTCTWRDDFAAESDGAPPAGGGGRDEDGGVTVVDQSSVGPYDFAVLQATDVEVLFEWLEANDYDIPADTAPFVEPYVLMRTEMEMDIHFLAFKLSKGSDAGDIAPVVMRYEADEPMIPIQLTAVAVQPDMPIIAHVLGDERAVPENYLHVEINQARIDWLAGGSNYDRLVTEAMDEAGGQGFATDFAGEASIMNDVFYVEGRFDTDALAAAETPFEFMAMLQSQGFMGDATLLGLFETFIPMPEELEEMGVRPQDFYNCLECYAEYVDVEGFDAVGFANAIDTTIVRPLRHAEELFESKPYITRLYTTLSAEEMTVDPVFVFNPDMGDVSNVYEADAIVDCGDGGDYWTSPVTIRLPDGREIVTSREMGGGAIEGAGLPAADSFAETGASGQPRVVQDNAAEIEVALAEHNAEVGETLFVNDRRRSGCTVGTPSGSAGAAFGSLLILIGLLRRRRSGRM